MQFPPPYESAVDRAIREAAERGAFDNLPGKGKPLPQLDEDELGWVRRWLDREGVSSEMLLPTPVQLRKEIDRLPQTLAALKRESDVRDAVSELNRRIAEHIRYPSGPRIPVRLVDAERAVAQWRQGREAQLPPPAAPVPEPPASAPAPRRRRRWWWWRGR
ncbi:DUF1992 domain-containing protein [Pseudonocardia broussonetiae]|uniref:DUF1992 domain-containing protein n=1 Tax=Pseudonocardia broussonetiae TaxID=2736640 RepID=A0A6M6JUV2_9PSEU|nr:DUF1992 domain-containing protein [Pseudonocardia broussonetiae]